MAKKARDSFTVQYGVQLLLASKGLTGFVGKIVGFVAAWILGDMVDLGILKIDLTIDKLKQALKEVQWRDAALKAYNKATAKVYTDEEKQAIRDEYLKALDNYIGF